MIYFCLFFIVLVFQDRVSLCSSGSPGTHFVDQAFFEFSEFHLYLDNSLVHCNDLSLVLF